MVVFNNKNIMSNINRKFLFKWSPLIQAERMIENIDVFDFVLNEEEMNKITGGVALPGLF